MSFVFGAWVIFKRLLRYVWNPSGSVQMLLRDTPPSFLVDSSLGQHKHVKLKVLIKVVIRLNQYRKFVSNQVIIITSLRKNRDVNEILMT